MKTLSKFAAAAVIASFGLVSAANAYPHHHRHCTTTFVHHHKVTRCH